MFVVGTGPAGHETGVELLDLPDFAAPSSIGGRVRHHAHQPGSKRTTGVELVELHQGRKKRVLRRVVSVFLVAQDGTCDTARLVGISLDQRTERAPVARPGTGRQLRFIHSVPCTCGHDHMLKRVTCRFPKA